MSIEHERIFSLIEFAQQTAKLKARPAGNIAQHNGFSLYEHQVQGLPGIHLNLGREEDNDDIWLRIDRLHETKPPEIKSPLLIPWIEINQGPESDPRLKDSSDGAAFIEAGTHHSSAKLVWGVGLGIWNNNGATLRYPLLTQLSEVSLNSETAAIEVRPRIVVEPRLEVDWYVSNDNAGVAEVEKIGKEYFSKSNFALSPYDRGSFEALLRAAVIRDFLTGTLGNPIVEDSQMQAASL